MSLKSWDTCWKNYFQYFHYFHSGKCSISCAADTIQLALKLFTFHTQSCNMININRVKSSILSFTGKMNMMIWGKRCWFSHPENTFPLANVLHMVLSKTLKWVLSRTYIHKHLQQQEEQEMCGYLEATPRFHCSSLSVYCAISPFYRTVPDHAHFLSQDFDSAVRLAAQHPLADLVETIWIVGGTQVYQVKQLIPTQ